MFFPPAYSARPWRLWQASTIRRIEGAERPYRVELDLTGLPAVVPGAGSERHA